MIWINESGSLREQPNWTLTGQLLLWRDGSPAHVRQAPFDSANDGWQAVARVTRSERHGNRWVTVRLHLSPNVQAQWEAAGVSPREHAARQLEAFLRLREWHADDLGILYLQ